MKHHQIYLYLISIFCTNLVATDFVVPQLPTVTELGIGLTDGAVGNSTSDISAMYRYFVDLPVIQLSVFITHPVTSECTTTLKVYQRWGAMPCNFPKHTEGLFYCEESTTTFAQLGIGFGKTFAPTTFPRNQSLYFGIGKTDIYDTSNCTFQISVSETSCSVNEFYAEDTDNCLPFENTDNIQPGAGSLVKIEPRTFSLDIEITYSITGVFTWYFWDGTYQIVDVRASKSPSGLYIQSPIGWGMLRLFGPSPLTVSIDSTLCPGINCPITAIPLLSQTMNVSSYSCVYMFRDLQRQSEMDLQCNFDYDGLSIYFDMNRWADEQSQQIGSSIRIISEDVWEGPWINFRICAAAQESLLNVSCYTPTSFHSPAPLQSSDSPEDTGWTLITIIAAPGGALVLVLLLLVIVFLKTKRKKVPPRADTELVQAEQQQPENDNEKMASAVASINHIKQEDIQIVGKIGKGAFGEVYKGVYAKTIDVAMKRLNATHTEEFEQEANILQNLKHPNIVLFLGIYAPTEDARYLVTEYMPKGSLLELLRDRADNFFLLELLKMAKDAAAGMAHLEVQNVIHRDLAARNLLVSGTDHDLCIKVADFGMSRIMTSETYISQSTHFPVKWCAPEILKFRNYTLKSDVWAYGVTLWEIFSSGAVPYSAYSNMEACTFVQEGGKLEKPPRCPEEVFMLMVNCWETEPENRPTFKEIYATVDALTNQYSLQDADMSHRGSFLSDSQYDELSHYDNTTI